jgi:transposase-like protein
MKTLKRVARRRRVNPARRTQLLATFGRSALSAAAFARRHGLRYSTFCRWRQGQGKAKPAPGFVQVELPSSDPPAGLVIELGPSARIRLADASSVILAARLLQAFCTPTPC